MFRKHYFCISFVATFLSITNGKISNYDKSHLTIPADILSFFDERFASFTSDLNSRLEELERRHAEDTRRIDMLEHLNANHVDQLRDVKQEMDGLRTANDNLQVTVNALQNQLHRQTSTAKSTLNHNISNIAPGLREDLLGNASSRWTESSNNTTIMKVEFRRKSHKDDNQQGNNLDRSTRVGLTSNVHAFHAILGHNLVDPGNDRVITFGNIVTLVGGDYSKNTGAFTCRQAGMYVFNWSVRVINGDGWIYTQIVRNGHAIGTANGFHGSTGSAAAVVQLSYGDEVWIKVHAHSSGADIEQNSSMFSGFLIN